MATAKKLKSVEDVELQAEQIEWPPLVFDVAVEAFDELSFPELRMFLSMMGEGLEDQVHLKTKQELSGRVHELIALDTVRAQVVYDRLVRLIPEPETPAPAPMNLWTATDFWPTYSRLIAKTKEDLGREFADDAMTVAMAKVEVAIRGHIEEVAKKTRKIEVVMPDGKVTTPKGLLHEKFDLAVQILSQGFPVLLVGPTQSGKTTLARQLAQALKLDFTAQSFSGGLTESKLFGRVLPTRNGAEFCGTPFLDAVENGKLFLADEIDASDSNVLTSMNMVIANGELWLPERDKKPIAKKHKGFRLVAAANTFGFGADARYVGRNALDYATLERFGCGVIYMDYDKRIESALARKEICEWAWVLRERIRRAQLNREMSTRSIIVIEQMTKAYGWTKTEWEERFFANWSKEEQRLLA